MWIVRDLQGDISTKLNLSLSVMSGSSKLSKFHFRYQVFAMLAVLETIARKIIETDQFDQFILIKSF